jgi:uncharacterized protein (TIGR04255 family)
MYNIPIKIENCPIEEAIFEIRFTTNIPKNAVFGVVYSVVKEDLPKLQELPASQIPDHIRQQDPNLRYQHLQRLSKDNLSLNIGNQSIAFSNTKNYLGWAKWSDFIKNILTKLKNTNILNNVERIGLRYINIFNKVNILEKTKIQLQLDQHQLIEETSNLRTELKGDIIPNLIKILQVGNAVNIIANGKARTGSVIDIDCIINMKDINFYDSYENLMEIAHKEEKELFFNLLKEDFLKSMKPSY